MPKLIKLISRLLPKRLVEVLVILRNRSYVLIANLRYACGSGNLIRRTKRYKDIPIIINNYNRLTYMCRLIRSLEERGYTNIYIIDNNSSYPPLLEYYKTCPYTVFKLNRNVGYKSLWETGIYELFKKDYYVYTDSDLEIDDSCPGDFMEYFVKILRRFPLAQKVGFGIKIDDLPASYVHKKEVIKWESQFWRDEISPGIYRAAVDTTFALYRPYCKGEANNLQKVFRTGAPYIIRHLPWYNMIENVDEERWYLATIKTSTHWSQISRDSQGL